MRYDHERIADCIRSAVERENRLILIRETDALPEYGKFGIHECSSLVFPLSGMVPVEYFTKEKTENLELRQGTALMIAPGSWTRIGASVPFEFVEIEFRKAFFRFRYFRCTGNPSSILEPEFFSYVPYSSKAAVDGAVQSMISRKDPSTPAGCLQFSALLQLMLEEMASAPSATKEDVAWNCICEAVETHYSEDVSREDIARCVGIHAAKVSRTILVRGKCSFSDLVNMIRLRKAVFLLRFSSFAIHDISAACGFQYTNYFIRVFRKSMKVSPLAFRKGKIN